jgi:hypothetical protein
MSTDRKYFTNHGFHLNKLGKERIAKEIVRQIREIVNFVPKNEPTNPLHWKDDHTFVTTICDAAQPISSTCYEGNTVQSVTKLSQEHCTQQERSKLGYILRMSNGYDKAEVNAAVETVIDKSASNKLEDEKS